MTTPTQNEIPSSTAIDVRYNAEKLDEIINSDNDTYTDRFGIERYTAKGLVGKSNQSLETLIDDLSGNNDTTTKVNYLHVTNVPEIPFIYFLSKYPGDGTATEAIRQAALSGQTVIFPAGSEYVISENDIPVAPFTKFIGAEGSYATFLITSSSGVYGTFDLRTDNGIVINGRTAGKFNTFRNLSFRYPGQVRTLTSEITAPTAYPPIFYGGAYESRFEHLDIGNCYKGFWLGGDNLGSASRVTIRDIIGTPLYYGLSLEQVRDVPVIANLRWNYNYTDATTYAYDSTVKNWIHSNGVAFHFGRCDWATCFNLFSFGYYRHIYMRSTRYTGSADRMRFIGCFADKTVIPLELRNFTNRVDFDACGFTGADGIGFTEPEPSKNIIYNVGDAGASVNFTGCQFDNYMGDAIRTGCDLNFSNCEIYDYGTSSSASDIKNGIMLTSPGVTINLLNTLIDGSSGGYTRCCFDNSGITHGTNSSVLNVSDGSRLVNSTSELVRWNSGVENIVNISHNSIAYSPNGSGVRDRNGWVTQNPRVFSAASVPTQGNYIKADYVVNTNIVILGVTGSRYTIRGWQRVTTGSTHVINVDWVVDKILIAE